MGSFPISIPSLPALPEIPPIQHKSHGLDHRVRVTNHLFCGVELVFLRKEKDRFFLLRAVAVPNDAVFVCGRTLDLRDNLYLSIGWKRRKFPQGFARIIKLLPP